MLSLLLTISALTLRLPNVETFEAYDWKPEFTEPKNVVLDRSTVAFFTHASRHFDPLCITQPAVIRVAESMKAAGLPTIYLHDSYNSKNPAWMYLYRDRQPTAFVNSDVGHIDLNFKSIRHVVSVGGYFGQCQRSTVEDSIRCWRRDAKNEDFRVTQIVDGIFCVSEYMKGTDPYYFKVREYFYGYLRSLHPKAVISVHHTLRCIADRDLAIDYLCRQVPTLPGDVNIVIDFFGHSETVHVSAIRNAPTLTLAYRRADQFLKFQKVVADSNNLTDRKLRRSYGSNSGRIYR